MKIAFLNKYQNKVFRGAETFVYELSRRLSKNHNVDVISDIDFLKIVRKKYEVIIPTNGRLQVIIVRKITWLTDAKMIVSGQSGMGWDDKVNLYSFPDAFIALSSKALDWARKVNPFVKSFYIPNGVDLKKFGPEGKTFATKLKKPIVLAVGAFTKQKRIDLAIRAVARLKNASLLVAGGGGELKEELRTLGRKLLGPRFDVISVPFEKMPEVYRACDVFTLPSRSSESFGNVLVEAMATGAPIVASDDPIRREIIGDAGLFTDPANESDYAEALEKVLTTNWGGKSRRQAEKFSWDRIAEQYEELFKTFIGKK
jgi:glycosyltransferase involved in cell wall biosynthesis